MHIADIIKIGVYQVLHENAHLINRINGHFNTAGDFIPFKHPFLVLITIDRLHAGILGFQIAAADLQVTGDFKQRFQLAVMFDLGAFKLALLRGDHDQNRRFVGYDFFAGLTVYRDGAGSSRLRRHPRGHQQHRSGQQTK